MVNEELKDAAYYGDIEAVKKALADGADIHTGNDYPLRWACMNGHLDILKLLIEKGADVKSLYTYATMVCNGKDGKRYAEVISFLKNQNQMKVA